METRAASAGHCGTLITGVDLGMEAWPRAAAYSGVHLAVLLAFHVDVRRQGKAKDVAWGRNTRPGVLCWLVDVADYAELMHAYVHKRLIRELEHRRFDGSNVVLYLWSLLTVCLQVQLIGSSPSRTWTPT